MDNKAHARRNIVALLGDFIFFMIGFAFCDPYTVLPVFVKAFTGSDLMVGVLAGLRVLAIALPQVWAAGLLAARPRKTPVLIVSSVAGRVPLLVMAGATLLWAGDHPWLVTGLLSVSVVLFFASEGMNGVTWPALVGKVIPEEVRGRFLGAGQFVSGIFAVGVGRLVSVILGADDLSLSTRWAIMFGSAFLFLMLSVASMFLVQEEEGEVETARVDVRRSLRAMAGHLREDARLRRLVALQIVLSLGSAAFPFLSVRAQEVLPGGESLVGTFVVLQNVGSIAGALICGQVVDRMGSGWAIRLGAAVQVALLSLVAAAVVMGIPLPAYYLAFLLMGFSVGSGWWSFTTYLLDLATDEQRPTYLAANGLLLTPVFASSILVGGLIQALLPEIVFGITAAVSVVGLGIAWRLPSLRRE